MRVALVELAPYRRHRSSYGGGRAMLDASHHQTGCGCGASGAIGRKRQFHSMCRLVFCATSTHVRVRTRECEQREPLYAPKSKPRDRFDTLR